jgi:two-component system, cell cycle response regulator
MTPLVLLVLWMRRAARIVAPFAAALSFGALVVLDAASPLPLPYAAVAGGALALLLGVRARKRALAIEASSLADVELGTLLVVAAFGAALRLDGSLDGRAFPLVYVCIGLISAFARPGPRAVVVLLALGLEIAVRMLGFGEGRPVGSLPHLAFMIVFAGLNVALLRGEITRVRKASRVKLDA